MSDSNDRCRERPDDGGETDHCVHTSGDGLQSCCWV